MALLTYDPQLIDVARARHDERLRHQRNGGRPARPRPFRRVIRRRTRQP